MFVATCRRRLQPERGRRCAVHGHGITLGGLAGGSGGSGVFRNWAVLPEAIEPAAP